VVMVQTEPRMLWILG